MNAEYLPAACAGSLALVILLGVFARWDVQKRVGMDEFTAAAFVLMVLAVLCRAMVAGP